MVMKFISLILNLCIFLLTPSAYSQSSAKNDELVEISTKVFSLLEILLDQRSAHASPDFLDRAERARILVDSWQDLSDELKDNYKDVIEIFPLLQTEKMMSAKRNLLASEVINDLLLSSGPDDEFLTEFRYLLRNHMISAMAHPLGQILKNSDLRNSEENFDHVSLETCEVNVACAALRKLLETPTPIFSTFLLGDFLAAHLLDFANSQRYEIENSKFKPKTKTIKDRMTKMAARAHVALSQKEMYTSKFFENESFRKVIFRSLGIPATLLFYVIGFSGVYDFPLWFDFGLLGITTAQILDFYAFLLAGDRWSLPPEKLISFLEEEKLKKYSGENQKRDWLVVLTEVDKILKTK